MAPAVGPENANFVSQYAILEDKPLTTKVLGSLGPRAPDTVLSSYAPKTNKAIMQRKESYELQKAMHSKMPAGPYYWQKADGVWGHAWLADPNCNATYRPMKHCPFGEYDPRMDNVMPHFEDIAHTKMRAERNATFKEQGIEGIQKVDPPFEVSKLRIYFRTPNVYYDRVEDGQGEIMHVDTDEFRECLYKAKSNRRAFLAQTQKMLQLTGPIKPPLNERPAQPKTGMQSLLEATGMGSVRRSGRTRNLPNWFAGPKSMPSLARGPTKRQLFKEGPDNNKKSRGPTKPKRKKSKKKRKKGPNKIPNSVLKAQFKIDRKEEDLKEAQFEALAGERELIKLGQDWRAAFDNANEEAGREATARVFFSLPHRSQLARDMFKLICGNCSKAHLQYSAEKFHAVALKCVREEYRAISAIDLVSPAKKTKNKAIILYGKQGPKIDGKQGPEAAVPKGPEITVSKGPKDVKEMGPKAAKRKGPEPAEQKGPKGAQQKGPKGAAQKGPKKVYHYDPSSKSRKAKKKGPKGPQATVPKGPKATVSKGPKATEPKGPKATVSKGPKATVPKGPEVNLVAVPKGPEVTPDPESNPKHWIRSTRAKSGFKGVIACSRASTPWRAKNSSGRTLGRYATFAEACEAVYEASQKEKAQKQLAKDEDDNPLAMWQDELKDLNF